VKGISASIVERDTPGVTIIPPEKVMGIRSGWAHAISFDCFIPAA
jgi:alkylation response protein AidB-like acyl-CoA dehydrogenase